jgi:aspartate racemase
MNNLSAWLVRQGVGPEVPVAVCAERSLAWVVGALGTLRAGGVYVPVNPMSPLERRAAILQDAGIRLILAEPHAPETPAPGVQVARLGEHMPAPADHSVRPDVMPGQAAYAIYTSGSTGKPKNVTISHESLRHYASVLRCELSLGPSDRYLHSASVEFSASIRHLFAPLTSGSTVVIASRDEVRDPARLASRMLQLGVTVFDTVPSYLKSWLAAVSELPRDWRDGIGTTLRLVLTTGEPLPESSVQSLHAAFPSLRVLNVYGQTETTGSISFHPVDHGASDPIPIGPPLEGTRFHVLNEALEPSREGELYVSGVCLARGYHCRQRTTATRFLPDPFSAIPGARMYRTGDRVIRLDDGNLVYKGRADNQVKFHGIRIDLGEIEAALSRHPDVEEAAAVLVQTSGEEPRLAGFAVLRPGSAGRIGGDELRIFLTSVLGEPVTPGLVVIMDSLPRTPSGKLDRQALRGVNLTPSRTKAASSPPQTKVERLVARCWEEVLGITDLGVEDEFFVLGGDSVQAMQMVLLLQRQLPVQLPLGGLFFQDPTLGVFAKAVEEECDFGEGAMASSQAG